MLKRENRKRIMPGVLMAPGGRIEFGEGIFEATRREIMEETQLEITNLQIKAVGAIYMEDIDQELYPYYVFADYKSGNLNPTSDDGDFMWMTYNEILGHNDILAEIKILGKDLFLSKDMISFKARYKMRNNLTYCKIEKNKAE